MDLYFPGKEALFIALYEEWDCGLAARVEAAVGGLAEPARRSPARPPASGVELDGHASVYAMCAIDALGIPAMTGTDGQITAARLTCIPCTRQLNPLRLRSTTL